MHESRPSFTPRPTPIPDTVLSAINELAVHVRAEGLSQADDLLAELLLLLHARPESPLEAARRRCGRSALMD